MSEPKTKLTLLLTPAERARLDALRLARGDRHASATIRALVRDAGGDTPRAPAPGPRRRSENTLGLVDLAPGAVLPDPPRAAAAPASEPDDPGLPEPVDLDVPAARADFLARVGCSPEEYLRRWRAGQIPDTGEGMFRYQRALMLEDSVALELMEIPDRVEADGRDAFIEALHGAAAAAIETELGHCLPQRPVAGAAELAELVLQALPRWAGLDPGGDPPDPLRPAHVRGAARAARELADALERLAKGMPATTEKK